MACFGRQVVRKAGYSRNRGMIEFHKGDLVSQGSLGIFPGAFNPPTNAHLALADAARTQHRLDQVVFLLPRVFPHKQFVGAPFEDRLALLEVALSGSPNFAMASSEEGLFIEIARLFREACASSVELFLLCGRDAARRIAEWDYGEGPEFASQLEEFQLLVGSRQGVYRPPQEYRGRIHLIDLPTSLDQVSSSALRQAIEEGRAWKQFVPQAVAREIVARGLYGAR